MLMHPPHQRGPLWAAGCALLLAGSTLAATPAAPPAKHPAKAAAKPAAKPAPRPAAGQPGAATARQQADSAARGLALATATVDRLLHHAHVCQTSGDSVRLTQALAGQGVSPLS